MRKPDILDSWALVAYFEGQKAGAAVNEILKKASLDGGDLWISTVNWGEVLYVIHQRYDRNRRDEVERIMEHMHLDIVGVDKDLARQAAEFKAVFGLGYADSFAAALAYAKKGTLWTGDKGFESVKSEISIHWLE